MWAAVPQWPQGNGFCRMTASAKRTLFGQVRRPLGALGSSAIRVPGAVEAAANEWVVDQLTKFRVQIKHTCGATKEAFLRVHGQTVTPEPFSIELPTTLRANRESNKEDAPTLLTFEGHLFADHDRRFPAKLSTWETAVLQARPARRTAPTSPTPYRI